MIKIKLKMKSIDNRHTARLIIYPNRGHRGLRRPGQGGQNCLPDPNHNRVRHLGGPGARKGLTLIELMIVVTLGTIIALVIVSLYIVTYRTLATEMRQDEMNWRCRQLTGAFSNDVQLASRVVYDGAGPYTPPSSQLYNYPQDANGQAVTSIPAGSKVLVLQLPSYDVNGIMANGSARSFDYIGYSWSEPAGPIPGKMIRTRIPAVGSGRQPFYGSAPGAATNVSSIKVQFHVASSYSSPTAYAGNRLADDAVSPSGQYLFQGKSPVVSLNNVDQVDLTAQTSGASWGQNVAMKLTSSTALRDWGME